MGCSALRLLPLHFLCSPGYIPDCWLLRQRGLFHLHYRCHIVPLLLRDISHDDMPFPRDGGSVSSLGLRRDILIVGSFLPCIYYGFYCEPHLKVIYLTIISLAGCGAAYIVLSPTYSRPSHRGARTSVFLALGLCAVVPVTHALYSHGYRKICLDLGFNWLITSGALYVTGALIYANRLPERWWPGKFDYWLSSHQIFHAYVVLAALSHYMCISTAAHHWHGVLGGVCLVS